MKRFIVTESERKNILKKYGLILEQDESNTEMSSIVQQNVYNRYDPYVAAKKKYEKDLVKYNEELGKYEKNLKQKEKYENDLGNYNSLLNDYRKKIEKYKEQLQWYNQNKEIYYYVIKLFKSDSRWEYWVYTGDGDRGGSANYVREGRDYDKAVDMAYRDKTFIIWQGGGSPKGIKVMFYLSDKDSQNPNDWPKGTILNTNNNGRNAIEQFGFYYFKKPIPPSEPKMNTMPPLPNLVKPIKPIEPILKIDKNVRRVESQCGLTLVGQKGENTFEYIENTTTGEKLGNYDNTKSTDWNIRQFCKQ
jgi:tetratricopeptide (TPR) repeat protein